MSKAVLTIAALSVAMALTRAESAPGTLRSFYIGSPAGFGLWTWQIVSVEPVGEDARVRVMRIQSVSDVCPEILVVQAAERRSATIW